MCVLYTSAICICIKSLCFLVLSFKTFKCGNVFFNKSQGFLLRTEDFLPRKSIFSIIPSTEFTFLFYCFFMTFLTTKPRHISNECLVSLIL